MCNFESKYVCPILCSFRCILAVVRKTKLKEKSEKRLKCQRHSFIQQLQKLEQKSKKSFQVVIFFFPPCYTRYLSLILTSLCPKITQNLPQIIIVHVFVISRFSQKCVLCHFQACHYLPLVVQRIDFIHSFVNYNIFPHFEHCDVVNAYDLWVYFYFLNIMFLFIHGQFSCLNINIVCTTI